MLRALAASLLVLGTPRFADAGTLFKILSGGDYTLLENEAQVITLTYQPTGAASDIQPVQFTGGGGAQATATGKFAVIPPKKPKRR